MTVLDRRFGVASGLAVKAPCRVATISNIALTGLYYIDGVMPAEGDRILVKNQDDAKENGIWIASTGNWQRAQDFNGARDVVKGTRILALAGAIVQPVSEYYVSSPDPIVIGETEIEFESSGLFRHNDQTIYPESFGAVGDDAAADAPAVLAAIAYQRENGGKIVFRSGRNYAMGDTRLDEGWGKHIATGVDGVENATLDFSGASDWATTPQTARVVIKGTPDTSKQQALTNDLASNRPVAIASAAYDSLTGKITATSYLDHPFTTGQLLHIYVRGSTNPAGQQAYLTMSSSNEEAALTEPVLIEVTGSKTFTYAPPHGGTPDATLTISSVQASLPRTFVCVPDTSAFSREMMVEIRSEALFASTTKRSIMRTVVEVINGTMLRIDRGPPPDNPLLVSDSAVVIPIPDAPEIDWRNVDVKCRGYNPAGAIADCAWSALWARRAYVADCGPIDQDFYGFSFTSCLEVEVTRPRNMPDRRNDGGKVTGFNPETYTWAYGGACQSVKIVDGVFRGQRHSIAEGMINTPYGQTEDVWLQRPLFLDRVSNAATSHLQIIGHLTVQEAVIDGGGGINWRVSRANIHVKRATNASSAVILAGAISNIKIDVDWAENIENYIVGLQPTASVTGKIEISVRGKNAARGIYYGPTASGITTKGLRIKHLDVENILFEPIFVNSSATSSTEVQIDYARAEGFGRGGGQTADFIRLQNCPNARIGTVIGRADGDIRAVSLSSVSGGNCDGLRISPNFDVQSNNGGTVTKLCNISGNPPDGTGHWAAGVIEEETCNVSTNAIAPKYRHDHRILINSTSTIPLTISGLTRGTHLLRPVTGTVTLQEGGNLQLSANADKAVTAQLPLPVTWNGAEFVQTERPGTASDTPFTPAGNIAATTVQAAIEELDTEKVPLTYLDTDGTLAANSDSRIATQKALKTYVDARLDAVDAFQYKGVIDCSANPNYPAASAGHTYRVSVAGKIGGGSGPNVEAGDILICITDGSSAGNHATVGANWDIIQVNIDGALTSANLGVTVQAYDADTMKSDTSANLTAGFTATSYNAGTKSSGTFTPDPTLGNIQHYVNGGAHTLAPPSSPCTMIIECTNASAGALATSGFSIVSGDAYDSSGTKKHIFRITKTNSYSELNIAYVTGT